MGLRVIRTLEIPARLLRLPKAPKSLTTQLLISITAAAISPFIPPKPSHPPVSILSTTGLRPPTLPFTSRHYPCRVYLVLSLRDIASQPKHRYRERLAARSELETRQNRQSRRRTESPASFLAETESIQEKAPIGTCAFERIGILVSSLQLLLRTMCSGWMFPFEVHRSLIILQSCSFFGVSHFLHPSTPLPIFRSAVFSF